MPQRLPATAARAALCGACYLGAGYLVLHLVPAPVRLSRELGHPHRWIAQYGPDAAVASVASAVLWLCAVWVAVGLTAMYLSMLPGLAGRCGSAVVRRVLPGAVRRLVVASTGASLLLSPLPATAAAGPAPAVPAPSWPVGPATRHSGSRLADRSVTSHSGSQLADRTDASRPGRRRTGRGCRIPFAASPSRPATRCGRLPQPRSDRRRPSTRSRLPGPTGTGRTARSSAATRR